MASVLKVDTIKSLAGNEAMTISEGGVPQFNTPFFDVYLSANQSVTNDALSLVQLNTVVVDTHGWFSTSTYRFTPQLAGYYWINGMVAVTGATSMTLQAGYIYKNGAQYTVFHIGRQTVNSSYYFSGGLPIFLNGTTDYVTLIGRIANTGSPALIGQADGTQGCRLSGYYLRGA